MADNWKEFRKDIETEETERVKKMLREDEKSRITIKKHILKDAEISTTALVSLVISYNNKTPITEQDIVEELNILGYMNGGKITESAVKYINSDKVIAKLKELVE